VVTGPEQEKEGGGGNKDFAIDESILVTGMFQNLSRVAAHFIFI
jgi:hypothetical protein